MGSISDIIEHYLKQMLVDSEQGVVEIKRSELADSFQCVPSQINYVISTRFTLEKGFLVESKRGGGGYIRIKKVPVSNSQKYYVELLERIGDSIPQLTAEHVIHRLIEEGFMTSREAQLMKSMVSRDLIQLPIMLRDQMRARMMRMMITILFANEGE